MPTFDAERPAQPLERAIGAPFSSPLGHVAQLESVLQSPIATSVQADSAATLRVSTRSRPSAVAGAIAGVMRQRGEAEVQAIGAGATNQAIKAIAIACMYLRDDGIDVCCVPAFIDVMIDGQERTAVRLIVQHRPR